jgi:hypothetical protein
VRYPHVESQTRTWDFASIYYKDAAKPNDSRADVGGFQLAYAEVFRDITALGGDTTEMIDAILYGVAYQATCEMRLSVTREPLDSVAELWHMDVDEAFSARLVARATEIMRGAALVGALRAIAWHLSQASVTSYRPEIVRLARTEARHCGMRSGSSNLIADDAHSHLVAAQLIKPQYTDARSSLISGGTLLLAAAHANLLLEPWNPFSRRRLHAEISEHAGMIRLLREKENTITPALDQSIAKLDEHYVESTHAFSEYLEQHGQLADIEAYFHTRRDARHSLNYDDLPTALQQLVSCEPKERRLV